MQTAAHGDIDPAFLYLGAAGEHHVMAECLRSRLDAFKLPVDKGFDLVVADAYSHLAPSRPGEPGSSGPPIYLQVKSRQVSMSRASDRPSGKAAFKIKGADLDLLIQTRHSALACVMFIDYPSDAHVAGRTSFSWWMPSGQVRLLVEEGYFSDAEDGRFEFVAMICEAAAAQANQNTYIKLLHPTGRHDNFGIGSKQFDFASLPLLEKGVGRPPFERIK